MGLERWTNIENMYPREYICSYCGCLVSSVRGYAHKTGLPHMDENINFAKMIYICPHCDQPTYFDGNIRIPGQLPGNPVKHLPKEVEDVYNEARRCVTVNAYTGSVMLCRKLLMNIAVQKGATPNQTFASYVDYLCDKGYVSGDNKIWADLVRNKGNEANHEIPNISPTDAEELIEFLELVLKSVFEFPEKAKQRMPKPSSKPTP